MRRVAHHWSVGVAARRDEQLWRTETAAAAEHARLGAMERRRATDGQAYTADEFRAWHHTTAQEFWDNALGPRRQLVHKYGVGCVDES